jgi:hypothetical protein
MRSTHPLNCFGADTQVVIETLCNTVGIPVSATQVGQIDPDGILGYVHGVRMGTHGVEVDIHWNSRGDLYVLLLNQGRLSLGAVGYRDGSDWFLDRICLI